MNVRSSLVPAALGLAALTTVVISYASGSGPTVSAAPATASTTVPATAVATTFQVDSTHSSAVFQIRYQNVSNFFGRFDKLSGQIGVDPEKLEASTFEISIDASSINTGNGQRDGHLRNPDFFNAKKYPELTFKSTKVEKNAKKGEKDLLVTGDLTLLGVTKSVTAEVSYGGETTDPRAGQRTGLDGTLRIDRKDFGLTYGGGMLGDEVTIHIGLTATAKK
jgi:polyisoprenoid-binding protein YceI